MKEKKCPVKKVGNKIKNVKKLSYEAEDITSKNILSRIEFILLVYIEDTYKNIEDYLKSKAILLNDLSIQSCNVLLQQNLDLINKGEYFFILF